MLFNSLWSSSEHSNRHTVSFDRCLSKDRLSPSLKTFSHQYGIHVRNEKRSKSFWKTTAKTTFVELATTYWVLLQWAKTFLKIESTLKFFFTLRTVSKVYCPQLSEQRCLLFAASNKISEEILDFEIEAHVSRLKKELPSQDSSEPSESQTKPHPNACSAKNASTAHVLLRRAAVFNKMTMWIINEK